MKTHYNNIFEGARVLITGHTGFKGSWLSLLLHTLKANVSGYALKPPTSPSLFKIAHIDELVNSCIADIRDLNKLQGFINKVNPEIIIHMAAQPLVKQSYNNPAETYSTNVMGTVNLFEAVRRNKNVKAVLNVTTDKCYENNEWLWGYRENDRLGGFDPYSNSKACSELVTSSYINSFFNPDLPGSTKTAVATARAGNVIGGGDWAPYRLIPDFLKAIPKGEKVLLRSPGAIRPWQHVLEPLNGYLTLISKLLTEGVAYNGAWNFGPADNDAKDVEWVISNICKLWGNNAGYSVDSNKHQHEASYLKLDCSKAKSRLNWHCRWDLQKSIESIVEWQKAYLNNENMRHICYKQIKEYFNS